MEIINPENYVTDEASWWFVFNPQTSLLMFPPLQCKGKTSSPYNLVVCDTLQECEDYIAVHNLKYPEKPKPTRPPRPPKPPTPEPTNQE
jgi:hypothetical protein